METLPESQIEAANSRGTYRSVKPPDQCVISYNFQHANSINFTHNLLIGMGFQEATKPHRNQQSSNPSPPNKQKLFSIIPQPKKIFRNEAQSVNKAYSSNVMPKRYVPLSTVKGQRKEAMNSHYVGPTQQSHWNERENFKQKEYQEQVSVERKGNAEQENHLPDEALNSPYGNLQKNKEETSRLGRNQKKQASVHESNKVAKRMEDGKEIHENESNFNGQDSIIHKDTNKNESVHRENKKQSSSLQKNEESFVSAHQMQGEKEVRAKEQSNVLNPSLASNSSQSMEAKDNEENHQSSPLNVASTALQFIQPSDINPNNTSTHKKPTPATHQVKSQNPAKPNTNQIAKDHENSFQQQRIKSKKEIQDEQLDELQAIVRRQESDKFKKGYFKIGANKQKQILPFQAGIEPFFANKNSFSNQTSIRNNTQYKSNDRKVKEKSGQANHSISGANLSNKLIANPRADIQLKANSIDYSNKISRNDGLLSSAFTQSKPFANKDKENTMSVMKKVPSNNLTAIVTSQRIKRGNEEKKMNNRTQVRQNKQPASKNERDHEDLTSNNQIKGFKVPEKIVSAKPNKVSKVLDASALTNKRESAIDAKMQQVKPMTKESNNKLKSNSPTFDNKLAKQSLNNKPNKDQARESKSPKQSLQNLRYSETSNGNEEERLNKISNRPKATVPRNANDKDIKFKKWRDSELQQIEKERRDSKRRDNSKASKEKKVAKRSDSQSRSKRNKEIDLDAEEEDKFGLFSKRKSVNKPIVANKKLKKPKGKQLTGPQQIQQEDIEERAESEKNEGKQSSSSSDSQQSNPQEERQQMQNESLQKISSIHSSRITEKEEEASEGTIEKRQSLQANQQNLQELLIATEESRTPNQMQHLPVQIELQDPAQLEDVQQEEQENTKQKLQQTDPQQNNEVAKENDELSKENAVIVADYCELNQEQWNIVEESPAQALPEKQGENLDNAFIVPASHNEQVFEANQGNIFEPITSLEVEEANANAGNKSQDFFEYNIKELSKFNETVNLTCNMTKYQPFERDIALYTRAPIISFLYDNCQKTTEQINSFMPSSQKCELFNDPKINEQINDEIVNRAFDILLSIDTWILQRIFEPFLNQSQQIGVWLYSQGFWKIYTVNKCDNFRAALHQALQLSLNGQNPQPQLQTVLRMISGVRVAKLKSTKKRVLSQLDYSLKKKHVLKALTSKNSKWGQRLFEVVKVQTSKQGGNVLKIKEKSQYFWVKEEKFTEIFQHFILICTRPSHFWTNKFVANKESHKSVLSFSSEVAAHGSVTLFYPSTERSSLYLYKQLQSKVLKFMGSLQEKSNQNGNIYFQFRLHGTYFLFLETPAACEMAIESTSKLTIGQPEYIFSQTLKNDKCEYVEIEQTRHQSNKGNRQVETLQKLRQKFISMVSSK